MADCEQLPTAVLVQILQLVEVRHRLNSCALVNSTWAAAAAAATDSIVVDADPGCDVNDLIDWLDQRGQQVSRLCLNAGWQEVYQLPCSQLRDLEVKCF
jgi:hypothetical protein